MPAARADFDARWVRLQSDGRAAPSTALSIPTTLKHCVRPIGRGAADAIEELGKVKQTETLPHLSGAEALKDWGERGDLNPRPSEPQSDALPLSYAHRRFATILHKNFSPRPANHSHPASAGRTVTGSAERLIILPEFRPGEPRRAADEDVRMVAALLVGNIFIIGVVPGEVATGECPLRMFAGKAEDD
jgi:hypothetical protein